MDYEKINEKYQLDKFLTLLEECYDKVSAQVKKCKVEEKRDMKTFLLYTYGKSITSAREVIWLCKGGFPDGALSIARNVFEQFIITEYMKLKSTESGFEELLDKYFDDYEIQRTRALEFEAEFVDLNEVKKQKYAKEIREIKKKYNLDSKSQDYWWIEGAGKSFSGLCDFVSDNASPDMRRVVRIMQFAYKRACLSIHASCKGNVDRLGSSFDGIDIGPWEEGQELSLYLTAMSLIYIIGLTFYYLDISDDENIKELNELCTLYNLA